MRPGRAADYFLKSGMTPNTARLAAVIQARNHKSCEDFSVSPDPIDPNRVNIFEMWCSRADLGAFRSSGSETDVFSLVESFDVQEYEI